MHAITDKLSLAIIALSLVACSSNTYNSSWMADNSSQLSGKRLSQITIPGSHYSNSYAMLNSDKQLTVCSGEMESSSLSNNARLAQIITTKGTFQQKDFLKYLNTQSRDITGQLDRGIRYLDLQVCLQSASFYTSNYYLTDPLETITQQIKDFLSANPKEIIIIDFDNNLRADYGYMTGNDINNLHNLLQMQFGSYLTPKQGSHQLTLADIWESNHRIILLSSNPSLVKYYDVWDKNNQVISPEASYTTIKKLTNIQQFIQSESATADSSELSILPIYSVFNPEANSLSQFNGNPNDHLIMDYLYTLPHSTVLNIIVSDHPYNSQLIEFAIQKNIYRNESQADE